MKRAFLEVLTCLIWRVVLEKIECPRSPVFLGALFALRPERTEESGWLFCIYNLALPGLKAIIFLINLATTFFGVVSHSGQIGVL